MIQEIVHPPKNGFLMLGVNIVLFIAVPILFLLGESVSGFFIALGMLDMLAAIFILPGYFIVEPNEAKALVLFGKYKGTVRVDGFHWANPFYKKEKISLRAHNFDTEKIKVNDKNGNPIKISAVIVWRVSDTAKALYAVNNYREFVHTQSESALRTMAGRYAYDSFGEDQTEVTLREEADVVNEELESEIAKRLEEAGIEVMEARINHLAYAEEIASAMLQRQQASAVVAARREIVDGAVGMVEMALEKLNEKQMVTLDEERKAAMVSNLLVVLVGDQQATPVVNTGTLHN